MAEAPTAGSFWAPALSAAGAAVFAIDRAGDAVVIEPSSVVDAALSSACRYASFLDALHPDARARVDRKLRDVSAADAGTTFDEEFRSISGSWLHACGRSIDDGGRRWIVGLVRNNEERRRRDDARLRSIQELSLSARSAQVFISMIAHDLKNPIGVIAGSARTLLEPGHFQRKALERIGANAERLARMIQRVREYARGKPDSLELDRRHVDARVVLERALAGMEPTERPAVRIDGETNGSWDEEQLSHAIERLVGETVARATNRSSVELRVDGGDPRLLRLVVRCDAKFDPKTAENAFRPFGGDDASGGLGLFAARQIIVAHGGDLALLVNESGATFEAKLPREIEIASAARVQSPEDITNADGAPRLLSGVTATLYGALPLYERAPASYWKIFERYAAVLDDALDRRIYRGESRAIADETRAIAEALGTLGAGANEVAELHARALRERLRDASSAKAQALVSEGRLLGFEVMGHLVTWYRRRAIINLTEEQPAGDAEK